MRTLPLLILAFVACAASSEEVRTAKTATYKVDGGDQLFAIAAQAAADKHYKVAAADDGHLTYETVPKWFSPEGDLQTAGAGDYTLINGHSVKVSFVVTVTQTEASEFVITVVPHTWQYIGGSPQLRPLEPEDPNLPPWVLGRADALSVAIYDRAKGFAIAAK
ncbi:MAG: hypothetical protein ABI591_16045 [Kofleriaceae bacterium]